MSTREHQQQQQQQPTGFRMSGFAREEHGNAIYSVAWSTDVFHDDNDDGSEKKRKRSSQSTTRQVRYMASCGGNHVGLYEVELPSSSNSRTDKKKKGEPLVLRQAYVDKDIEGESFYACAFGGRCLGKPFGYTPVKDDDDNIILATESDDSSNYEWLRSMTDTREFTGPQLLCVAGKQGIIKCIDTVQQQLCMTLSGHVHEIHDLKFSPTNEWLLLSASKDESVRLWNLQTASLVSIFGGHNGHREAVISVAWHPMGNRFASSGMDNTVKLWKIGEGTGTHKALQASESLVAKAMDQPLTAPPTTMTFKAAFEQQPYFSSNKLHHDYVDCVQFVGDLVLSKSVHDKILLWKPTALKRPVIRGKVSHQKPPNEAIVLAEYKTRNCSIWFIRFDTTSDCRLLAMGNQEGDVRIWSIDTTIDDPKKVTLLSHPRCQSAVRMIRFCPDDKCFIAACEDSTIWKWDATFD